MSVPRGKYLGFVAHEIKNPLATALWSCDLLKRMEPADRGTAKGEKVVDASLRALRRMRRLVDDFFTLERLKDGGLELREESSDLAALIDGALHQMQEKDGIATADWSRDVPQGLAVRGDGELMRRALRGVLEILARPVNGEPQRPVLIGRSGPQPQLVVRSQRARPLVPQGDEALGGDAAGATFAFPLAFAVMQSLGGELRETDEGLVFDFKS